MSSSRRSVGTASTRRRREAARAATARRRRTGWIITAAVLVAVAGTVLGLHATSGSTASSTSVPVAALGKPAPDAAFTTVAGKQVNVSDLRGRPTLLWFVTTWCPSCQTGAKAIAANIEKFKAAGVRVVTAELYQDLGQSGPSIEQFGRTLAGAAYNSPDWQFGTASAALTHSYDPNAYLDIYYLLDRDGNVVYVNGSPDATMSDLLTQVGKLA